MLRFMEEIQLALTNREYKTPPAHIEGKATRCSNHDDRNNEPNDSEAPKNETDKEANNIEYVARISDIWEAVGNRKQFLGEFAECDDAVSDQCL